VKLFAHSPSRRPPFLSNEVSCRGFFKQQVCVSPKVGLPVLFRTCCQLRSTIRWLGLIKKPLVAGGQQSTRRLPPLWRGDSAPMWALDKRRGGSSPHKTRGLGFPENAGACLYTETRIS